MLLLTNTTAIGGYHTMFTTKREAGTTYAKVIVRMYNNPSTPTNSRTTVAVTHYWPITHNQSLADITQQVHHGWDHSTLQSVTIHASNGNHLTISEHYTPEGLVYGIHVAGNYTTLKGGMDDALTIASIMLANPCYTMRRTPRA